MARKQSFVAAVAMALIGALSIAGATALAGNGKGGGNPSPLPQAQAQLAITTGSVSSGVVTQQVSPAVVAAAAAQPGAVTIGVIPSADGTVPATASAAAAVAPLDTTSVSCWAVNSGWTWGTWPYNQHLNDLTYWCAHYNAAITSVTTTPSASSALCDSSASGGQVIGGGVGYRYVDEQVNGSWSCPTDIPWVTLHTSHYLQTSHNSIGSSQQIGEG